MCSGIKTSPDLAVFANGVMIRYLDFNDGYTGREAGHPSDSIAALLSAAEISRASGRDLIVATVIARPAMYNGIRHFVFVLHYITNGTTQTDQTRMALRFVEASEVRQEVATKQERRS